MYERVHPCEYVYGGRGCPAPGLPPDCVNVRGELVKAGNASPCCIEPLDWRIIILGTHPLFSPSVPLLRLLGFLALPRSMALSIFGLL